MNGNIRLPGFVVCEGGGYDLALAKASVGPGWHRILERLFSSKPPWIWIVQVKEKFGGLRVYIESGATPGPLTDPTGQNRGQEETRVAEFWAFQELIDAAGEESITICEDCGAPGKPRSGSWIRTLCEACQR